MNKKVFLCFLSIFLLFIQVTSFAFLPQLPIRPETRIERMPDFKGVLLKSEDGVLQIDAVVWQIHANGALDIGEFKGFNDKGERIEVSRVADDARVVSTIEDLRDFYLLGPDDPESVWVERAVFGTDSKGFLRILELYGREVSTGSNIEYLSSPTDACALVTVFGCSHVGCVDPPTCGAYPGCPCQGTGTCTGYTRVRCEGDCPEGERCRSTQGGTLCECVKEGPALTQWGLIVLVVLLISSAVFITLRRRRATEPA